MPAEYFKDAIQPQLCSLFEEDALKDATIALRTSRVTMSSCILSLLSPVLRTMVCGSFRESTCKEIVLDDVESNLLLKLLRLACGKDGIVVQDVDEMVDLGELADRLQMEAVRSEIEDQLLKELSVENCCEMVQRSEGRGLELFQKGCYKILRDYFGDVSQEDFLKLREETIADLLGEDALGVDREEDVFEALVRWMSGDDEGIRGEGLLRKIRYGVMSDEYLSGLMSSALLPGHEILKELVKETMAKKGGADNGGTWDGVERLCGKWMVSRGIIGSIIGADVLESPGYVAIDGQGQIIVSDSDLHKIIVFSRDGSIVRRFGQRGRTPGKFDTPKGVAVDHQGHIVVADFGNHRIQVLNEDGSVVCCFGSQGDALGQLFLPRGVAIDREGHIVVADSGNSRIQVFDANGAVLRHFGSFGCDPGDLVHPTAVAVDGAGRIVVTQDPCDNIFRNTWRVQIFNGDGSLAQRGFVTQGEVIRPRGVAVDSAGRIIIADIDSVWIRVFNADGSLARNLDIAADGVDEPCFSDVAMDRARRIVIADSGRNHRVHVLRRGR